MRETLRRCRPNLGRTEAKTVTATLFLQIGPAPVLFSRFHYSRWCQLAHLTNCPSWQYCGLIVLEHGRDALLCRSLFISTGKIGSNSVRGEGETDKEMHPNYCLFPCNFISPACNLPLGSLKTGTLNMTGRTILICGQHFYPTRLQKLTHSPILDEGCPFMLFDDGS